MGFEKTVFGSPVYAENSVAENQFIIIACEGAETEYQYFNLIKNELDLKATVKMEILERDKENRHSSAPTKVVETLQGLSKERLQTIKIKNLSEDSYDIYWAVVDREKQKSKEVNLRKAKEICDNEGYMLALTNPAFEFWLLLHVVDIKTYDKAKLFSNEKESIKSKKRYIEKELTRILGSYKKANIKKCDFISLDKIKFALKQEKLFENNLDDIIDNLGSNIGLLINSILKI